MRLGRLTEICLKSCEMAYIAIEIVEAFIMTDSEGSINGIEGRQLLVQRMPY